MMVSHCSKAIIAYSYALKAVFSQMGVQSWQVPLGLPPTIAGGTRNVFCSRLNIGYEQMCLFKCVVTFAHGNRVLYDRVPYFV